MIGIKETLSLIALVALGCQKGVTPAPEVPSPVGGVNSVAPQAAPAKEVIFKAPDGTTDYADFYASSASTRKGVILMFHQAGSSAAEYKQIAPRVVDWGFDCLAVDQRSGGDMFEVKNRTAEHASGKTDFLAAYDDLQGALAWAHTQKYKSIVVWGSSYSASLVFRLAADHPEIRGVVAFSPGEYFNPKGMVADWNKEVKVPVFVACTKKEQDDGGVQNLFDAAPKTGSRSTDKLVALDGGVHGSSTLLKDRSEAADAYWAALQSWFKDHDAAFKPADTRKL